MTIDHIYLSYQVYLERDTLAPFAKVKGQILANVSGLHSGLSHNKELL